MLVRGITRTSPRGRRTRRRHRQRASKRGIRLQHHPNRRPRHGISRRRHHSHQRRRRRYHTGSPAGLTNRFPRVVSRRPTTSQRHNRTFNRRFRRRGITVRQRRRRHRRRNRGLPSRHRQSTINKISRQNRTRTRLSHSSLPNSRRDLRRRLRKRHRRNTSSSLLTGRRRPTRIGQVSQ